MGIGWVETFSLGRVGMSLWHGEGMVGDIPPAWRGGTWIPVLAQDRDFPPSYRGVGQGNLSSMARGQLGTSSGFRGPTCPLVMTVCGTKHVSTTMVKNLLRSTTICSEEGIPGREGGQQRASGTCLCPTITPGDTSWDPWARGPGT